MTLNKSFFHILLPPIRLCASIFSLAFSKNTIQAFGGMNFTHETFPNWDWRTRWGDGHFILTFTYSSFIIHYKQEEVNIPDMNVNTQNSPLEIPWRCELIHPAEAGCAFHICKLLRRQIMEIIWATGPWNQTSQRTARAEHGWKCNIAAIKGCCNKTHEVLAFVVVRRLC